MPFNPNSAKKAGKKSKRGPAKKEEKLNKNYNLNKGLCFGFHKFLYLK